MPRNSIPMVKARLIGAFEPCDGGSHLREGVFKRGVRIWNTLCIRGCSCGPFFFCDSYLRIGQDSLNCRILSFGDVFSSRYYIRARNNKRKSEQDMHAARSGNNASRSTHNTLNLKLQGLT